MRRIKGLMGKKVGTMTAAALIVAARVAATSAAIAQSPAGQAGGSTPPPKKIVGFKIGPVMNQIKPDQFFTDPPTLENLGFRWYIEGDSNRNASVAVSYRRRGENAWKPAQPMLRVHHEVVDQADGGYRTGNLFAGSVLGLEPATSYEVRFEMTDPDGGASAPKIVAVATRDEPRGWVGGRRIEVFPDGFSGKRPDVSFVGLQSAYDAARAGDWLLLRGGVYRGPFTFAKSGEAGKPIVIRGRDGEEAILEGSGRGQNLVMLSGASHHIIENLVLRNAREAITTSSRAFPWTRGPGASWIKVRGCHIENVVAGIWTMSENSHDWTILDNHITGFNPTWHPRPQTGYMEGSHTGVNVYGRGIVVANNRISRFADSLAIANFRSPVADLSKHPVNIDFYNNDLSFATDDTIEADYGAHNIRVYRNRLANSFTALSAQPTYGGPIYFIRNEIYGTTELVYKLNNYPAGILAYHNTSISTAKGLRPPAIWQNSHFRNNLILGATSLAVDTGSLTPYSSLDYNGYFGVAREGALFRWKDGQSATPYPSLAAFSGATGHEKHGLMVDFSIFENAPLPVRGATTTPQQYDLRLRAGSVALDAGLRLPNINDDFTGAGADLGAHERGRALPRYGPRSHAISSAIKPPPELTQSKD